MVYPAIINRFKEIKLFTVHDSVHFPGKYYPEIKKIWDQKIRGDQLSFHEKKRQEI